MVQALESRHPIGGGIVTSLQLAALAVYIGCVLTLVVSIAVKGFRLVRSRQGTK